MASTAGGHAARLGMVSVGDQLISTSGVTFTGEQVYGEVKVKAGKKGAVKVVRALVRMGAPPLCQQQGRRSSPFPSGARSLIRSWRPSGAIRRISLSG